jgi:Domain of unknown function (DUF4386)
MNPTLQSLRRSALVGGTGLLLLALLAAFGNIIVLENLVTWDDATETATEIADAEGLFRLGVASLTLTAVLDVIVAWALLRVFAPVSASMSTLAAWLRLAFAGVFLVAIGQLVGVVGLVADQRAADALASLNAFDDIWDVGLVLFGLHLALVGYLAYRSGYVPRFVGVLLVVAGLGYLVDSFGTILADGYSVEVAQVTFVGEALLMLWLLVRGHQLTPATANATPTAPATAPEARSAS